MLGLGTLVELFGDLGEELFDGGGGSGFDVVVFVFEAVQGDGFYLLGAEALGYYCQDVHVDVVGDDVCAFECFEEAGQLGYG